MTSAVTLWWMMVLLSSPTMSIVNPEEGSSQEREVGGGVGTHKDSIPFELEGVRCKRNNGGDTGSSIVHIFVSMIDIWLHGNMSEPCSLGQV